MKNIFFAFFMILFSIGNAWSSDNLGFDVSKKMVDNDMGWGNTEAKLRMTLANSHGEESVRELKIKTLEDLNEGDKSITLFLEPKDVSGVALLTHSHIKDDDDQWLFLPSLKRIKRIASSNKSGPFMGSEFSFEDFSSFELEKYEYEYLRAEKFNDVKTHVVAQYPLTPNSGYKKRVVWIDDVDFKLVKADFYDRKDELLKTLDFSDYRLYLGKYWRSHKMHMENHQNKKTTTLEWTEYKFNEEMTEADFTKNSLKRVR